MSHNPHAQTPPHGGRPPHQQQASYEQQQYQPISYSQQQQQQQQPSSGPYQVLQAQLSPPHAARMQQQYSPPKVTTMTTDAGSKTMQPSTTLAQSAASSVASMTPAASQLAGKIQNLFWNKGKDPNEPNFGFNVTEKLAQQHHQAMQQRRATSSSDNQQQQRPHYQYQVTKLRSWRTGYTRIFALHSDAFVTLDPDSYVETNRWPYRILTDWLALPNEPDCILLQVTGTASEKLKLCIHGNVPRCMVLSNLLQLQDESAQLPASETMIVCNANRMTRIGTQKVCDLHVKPYGIVELSSTTKQTIRVYRFVDVLACSLLADTGIVLTLKQPHKSRLWFLPHATMRSQVMTRMAENMTLLGLSLQMQESFKSSDEWLKVRQNVSIGTVAMTWQVTKSTLRHDSKIVGAPEGWVGGIVTRELLVTGLGYLVERDGRGIVSVRKLSELVTLVRHGQSNELTIEFENGSHQAYSCGCRDALLVSIMDAAATLAKNYTIHVSDVATSSYTLCSSGELLDASAGQTSLFQQISIPYYCLKKVQHHATQSFAYVSGQFASLQQQEGPIDLIEHCQSTLDACREFNASVLPTGDGLSDGTKSDKNISAAVGALWGLIGRLLQPSSGSSDSATIQNLRETMHAETIAATFFQTLYRLSQSATGYKVTVELTSFQLSVPSIWGIRDAFCKFCALLVLDVLLSGLSNRDLETEYVNKSVIFKGVGQPLVDGIVGALVEPSGHRHSVPDSGPGNDVSELVLMAASDTLQNILCSYHDTTAPEHFSAFIVALSDKYRSMLNTLRSKSPCVIENTALLLHLLSDHAPQTAAAIRDAALSSSILLHHFYAAIFSPLEGQRFLSRYLCSLWMSGPMDCDEKRLLKRMVPAGFLAYLNMPLLSPMEEDQLDNLEHDVAEENIRDESGRVFVQYGEKLHTGVGAPSTAGTNTARLRKRIAIAAATAKHRKSLAREENFRIFFHVLTRDNSIPDLIWNQQTRRELRIALEGEIDLMTRQIDARGIDNVAWNHQQFKVKYPSLDNETMVGNIYMRLWLNAGDGFIRAWDEPLSLFELLFRKFLCEIGRDDKMANMCIRCMDRLYAIHASKIGPFSDVMILVRSMASTKNVETQHRLLGLIAVILGVSDDDHTNFANVPENAEQLLNIESIGLLCQFVAWGHTDDSVTETFMARSLASSSMNPPLIKEDAIAPTISHVNSLRPEKISLDANCPAVWFIAIPGKIPPIAENVMGPFRLSDLMRMIKADELTPFHLVASSHVEDYDHETEADRVTESHIDTGKWKRLDEVWQLRWQLCRDADAGSGVFKPTDVALLALKALKRLTELHRSLDSQGVPYYPIPLAKRVLCASTADIGTGALPLSIIVQALLCVNNLVVNHAAELLCKILEHNDESVRKFYLTGAFFFACCYTGSDFKALAKLLRTTHLKQHFLSGFAATTDKYELRMRDRSILGNIIPEGLLYILDNYGVERFAEVFVGNVDTPEVIWSHDMRMHLIEMVRQHLGDFPLRLYQTNTAEYEYCPMPGIAYERLKNEMFCHNYYLSNLCDEARFPDWPISKPVEVFKACLEHFKKQAERDEQELNVAVEKARTILKLSGGDGAKELRRAYRSLARQYHPDKNPTGREMFHLIQMSYELLLPMLESGQRLGTALERSDDFANLNSAAQGFEGGISQMMNMGILIKAQVIIYRRYEKEMSLYKYPAYDELLRCILIPASATANLQDSCLLDPERASFILLVVELIFRTCLASPPNAEELVRQGGVARLSALLAYYTDLCVGQLEEAGSRVPCATLASIVIFLLRTISGLAHFDNARTAIAQLEKLTVFLRNIRECADGTAFRATNDLTASTLVVRYALECVAPLARHLELQEKLIGSGFVWPLLQKLLLYDSSLSNDNHLEHDEDEYSIAGNSAAATNLQAVIAVSALAALCGAVPETEKNRALTDCLNRLMTASVSRLLRNKRPFELLHVLNSNIEKPDIIWNNAMKKQLEATLDEITRTRVPDSCFTVEDELSCVIDFEFEALRHEIQIGSIFIRVFNSIGREAVGQVPEPVSFLADIIRTIGLAINNTLEPAKRLELHVENEVMPAFSTEEASFLQALKALRTLAQSDGLLESILSDGNLCIATVLVELLGLPASVDSELFEVISDILAVASSRREFSDRAVHEGSLWRLLTILERPESGHALVATAEERMKRGWSFLEGMVSSPSVANLLLSSSGLLEVLGVLVGYVDFTKIYAARLGAAKVLSRLMWDPSTGTIATATLDRLIPSTLTIILKDNPEQLVTLFDGDSDSPELLWDAVMRGELRKVVGLQLDACLMNHKEQDCFKRSTKPDANMCVKYDALERELYIGGVYLSRFVKEPTYNLRDPSFFLESLLKRWDEELMLYVSSHGSVAAKSNCTALSDANQMDVLLLVTVAIVYLCKVRDPLCDKLSQWGYMQTCVSSLPGVLANKYTGTPLLSIMRVLHVATNRLTNVEALALTGDVSGKAGIVEYTLQAIGLEVLHAECGLMIEFLTKLYKKAIGDVKSPQWKPGNVFSAPSPAPGEGSVRQKVLSGDDPLAMMGLPGPTAPSPQPVMPQPNNGGSYISASSSSQGYAPTQSYDTAQYIQQQDFRYSGSHPLHPQTAPQQQQVQQQYKPYSIFPPNVVQQNLSPSYGAPVQQQPQPQQQLDAKYLQQQQNYSHLIHTNEHRTISGGWNGQSGQPAHIHAVTATQNLAYQVGDSVSYSTNSHQPINGMQSSQSSAADQPNSYATYAPQLSSSTQQYPSAHAPQQAIGQRHEQPGIWLSPAAASDQQPRPQIGWEKPAPSLVGWPTGTPGSYTQRDAVESISGGLGQQDATQHSRVQYDDASVGMPSDITDHRTMGAPSTKPVVETVPRPSPQYRPDAVQGTGIDARTREDPQLTAETQAASTCGALHSAQGRVSLFQQALSCNLCSFMIDRILENPELASVKDPIAAKTHAIDLLKTLTTDPGYGPKFKLILDDIPAWKKYKLQDHSLYLTGKDQRSDYLLTDGLSDPTRLLTER
ncbi:hypothetical protein MPSEU_000159900 [Mayamaea pseudoterrestris]|nr:hypothetical protein MPSEU_000159900 [Mayamaea pseudoterrestris]